MHRGGGQIKCFSFLWELLAFSQAGRNGKRKKAEKGEARAGAKRGSRAGLGSKRVNSNHKVIGSVRAEGGVTSRGKGGRNRRVAPKKGERFRRWVALPTREVAGEFGAKIG